MTPRPGFGSRHDGFLSLLAVRAPAAIVADLVLDRTLLERAAGGHR